MVNTTIRETFRDSVWYTMAQFLSRAGGIVLLPLYASWFRPSEFGTVQSITVILSAIYTVVEMEIVSSANRLYYEYNARGRVGELIGTHLAILTVGMLIVSGFVYLFVNVGGAQVIGVEGDSVAIALGTIGVYFWAMSDYGFAILRLRGRSKLHLGVTILQLAILLGANLALVGYAKLGIKGVFLSLLITYLVTFLAFMPHLVLGLRFSISVSLLRRTLGYCSPLLVLALLEWVRVYFYQLYVAHKFGQMELGFVAVAQKIVHVYMVVAAAFQMAWTPRVMEQASSDRGRELCSHYYRYSLMIFTIMLFLISLFAKEIIYVIAPPEYLSSFKYVVPLFAIAFGGVLAIYFGNGLMVSENTVYYPLGYLVGVTLGIPMILVGGNMFGIYGALIASGIFSLILAFITLYMSNRVHHIAYSLAPLVLLILATLILGLYNAIMSPIDLSGAEMFMKLIIVIGVAALVYHYWLNEAERDIATMGLRSWIASAKS